MVEECVFGRIDGVDKILWMWFFQGCTILPYPRMLGLSYGISPGIWVVRTLFSQDSTMIGRWKRWKLFSEGYMAMRLEEGLRMSCIGGFQRKISLRLNLSSLP